MKYLHVFIGSALMFFALSVSAQVCPAVPKSTSFYEECFISASTPDHSSKGKGVWLPEATLKGKGEGSYLVNYPVHIPDNRKTWALSIVHGWNYSRNILQQIEHPKMSFWMATVVKESAISCDTEAKWGDNVGNPLGDSAFNWGTSDGCYHLASSGYLFLKEVYPFRFKDDQYNNLIAGNNFSTSSLAKAYYDIFVQRTNVYQHEKDWDALVSSSCDVYANEKLLALGYNKGVNSLPTVIDAAFNDIDNCYWTLGNNNYTYQIADMMAIMENNSEYPTTTMSFDESSFDGYYNESISWSDLTDYFSEIDDLYFDVNFATEVEPAVKKAFLKLTNDDLEGTIPFTQIGEVMDAIILSLPKEDPLYYLNEQQKCKGDLVPVGRISIEGDNELCVGQYTTLTAELKNAEDYDLIWKIGEKVIGIGEELVVDTTVIGTYEISLEICKDGKCNIADCGYTIDVIDCEFSCDLTATASVKKNAFCTTSNEGIIHIDTENGSAGYQVKYQSEWQEGEFELEAHDFDIKNLTSGLYQIEITDLFKENCKAYTNIEVGYGQESNEILDVKEITLNDCGATLKADIQSVDTERDWVLQFYAQNYMFWDQSLLVRVQTESIDQKFVADENNDGKVWEKIGIDTLSFAIGEKINISLESTKASSPSQPTVYIKLYNPDGELAFEETISQGTLTSADKIYELETYTIQHNVPMTEYFFSWTPSEEVENVDQQTTVVTASHPLKQTYVVEAINSITECKLTDSITVNYNCQKLCDGFNVEKTGEIVDQKICEENTIDYTINATGLALSYQWFKNGKEIFNTTNSLNYPKALKVNAGMYVLEVTDACEQVKYSDSLNISVDVCTGNQDEQNTQVTVYPNPTNGQLYISTTDAIQNIVILSLDGKKLIETQEQMIDLSTYPAGLYLVKVSTLQQTYIVKVEKK